MNTSICRSTNIVCTPVNEGRFSYTYFYFFTGKNRIAKTIQND